MRRTFWLIHGGWLDGEGRSLVSAYVLHVVSFTVITNTAFLPNRMHCAILLLSKPGVFVGIKVED
jgi:hypothetical protein